LYRLSFDPKEGYDQNGRENIFHLFGN